MRSVAVNLRDHVGVPKEDLERAHELMTCFNKSLPDLAARSTIPTVQLHELKPQPLNMSVAPEQITKEHWFRPTAFAKPYIPEYLPNASRALWFDVDTLLQGDVLILTSFPMKHSLAASLENAGMTNLLDAGLLPGYKKYADKINTNASHWFNPGVPLIDAQKYKWELRSQRISNWFSILHGVQGEELMLNFDFKDECDLLDSRWNYGCLTAPYMEMADCASTMLLQCVDPDNGEALWDYDEHFLPTNDSWQSVPYSFH